MQLLVLPIIQLQLYFNHTISHCLMSFVNPSHFFSIMISLQLPPVMCVGTSPPEIAHPYLSNLRASSTTNIGKINSGIVCTHYCLLLLLQSSLMASYEVTSTGIVHAPLTHSLRVWGTGIRNWHQCVTNTTPLWLRTINSSILLIAASSGHVLLTVA